MARQTHDSGKTKRYSLSKITLFFFIVLASCTQLPHELEDIRPVNLHILSTVNVAETPSKACFTAIDSTFYFLYKKQNKIEIYRHKKKENTIGGTGFEKTKFFRISDITTAPNGQLLVLDPLQRKIKKFDKNGNHLLDINLPFMQEPCLLTVSEIGNYYIYDKGNREVFTFNEMTPNTYETFGKFQLESVQRLHNSDDFIYLIDEQNKETFLYNEFGFIENQFQDIRYFDAWKQSYWKEKFHIEHIQDKKKFLTGLQPLNAIFFSDDFILLIFDKKVQLAEIEYQSKRNQ